MASAATNYLTVIGSGGESEPSCCVTTRAERLLFNCPEGTQRAMTEHKLKLSNKVRNVLFTRGDWNFITGITDVVLKACEEGQETLRLVGPEIRAYVLSTSYFLGQRPQMSLQLYTLPRERSLPSSMQRIILEDKTTVDVIMVLETDMKPGTQQDPTDAEPSKRESVDVDRGEDHLSTHKKRMRNNDGHSCPVQNGSKDAAGDSQVYPQTLPDDDGALPAGVELTPHSGDITDLSLCYSPFHRRKHSRRAFDSHRAGRGRGSVCYVVTFPPLPGKFDAKAADALGVKGKLRRELIEGRSVTLPDGSTVAPEQCVGAGQPGGAAVVVDCQTRAEARALLHTEGALTPLYDEKAGGQGVGAVCVVHMGAAAAVESEEYRAWMARLPAGPAHTHIVINHRNRPQRPLFVASERYLRLLHSVDADCFPLSRSPYHRLLQHGAAITAQHPTEHHPSLPPAVVGWPLLRYIFPPHKKPGLVSAVPDTAMLHYYCLQGCICPAEGGAEAGKEGGAREVACGECRLAADGGAAHAVERVVFLGTGASAPFKYRTVSSILLLLADGCTAILDAGDGTYGALVRKFGVEGAGRVLRRLRMVWVSHKHADHISGVAGLLLRRQQAMADQEDVDGRHDDVDGRHDDVDGAGVRGEGIGVDEAGGDREGEKCDAGLSEVGEGVVCGVCGAECAFESSLEMHHRACHPRHKISKTSTSVQPAGEKSVGGVVVVGPMWLEAWLRTLSRLEDLRYDFIECQELAGTDLTNRCSQKIRELIGGRVRAVLVQHSFPSYGIILEVGGFKLVYSGDTRPCEALAEAGQHADLLIHEATFDDEMEDKAVSDRHSTVREALGVAAKMQAKRTILTHFSSRFEKLIPDLRVYGTLGEKVACAVDGLEVCTRRLDEMQAVSLRMAEKLVEHYAET